MGTNEVIARWLGKTIVHPGQKCQPGDICSDGAGALTIVGDYQERSGNSGTLASASFCRWSPDTDISLWHGDQGLLQKIEDRGLASKFLNTWIDTNGWRENWQHGFCQQAAWAFRRAEAPQLAAALLKCIEGEKEANPYARS